MNKGMKIYMYEYCCGEEGDFMIDAVEKVLNCWMDT